MNTLGVLVKARSLIENPDHWTKGNSARNIEGGYVRSK